MAAIMKTRKQKALTQQHISSAGAQFQLQLLLFSTYGFNQQQQAGPKPLQLDPKVVVVL